MTTSRRLASPASAGEPRPHRSGAALTVCYRRALSDQVRLMYMAEKKVWFITGAGRGMGVDIAQAALGAGHAVVATGRNTEAVSDAVGEADDLLVVELDITKLTSAEAAVQAALDRFGRIDVLVNN